MVVLTAWRTLQKLRRDELSLLELPVASLSALTANINRDPSKGKPFAPSDFALFKSRNDDDAGALSPEVAATALALRHEDIAPPLLLAAWPEILASANDSAVPPAVRALRSDDGAVWVLCPRWEGRNVRGGLVLVMGAHGAVTVRDIDRSLATYVLQIPQRPLAGWLEGGLLLVAENSVHGPAVIAD